MPSFPYTVGVFSCTTAGTGTIYFREHGFHAWQVTKSSSFNGSVNIGASMDGTNFITEVASLVGSSMDCFLKPIRAIRAWTNQVNSGFGGVTVTAVEVLDYGSGITMPNSTPTVA